MKTFLLIAAALLSTTAIVSACNHPNVGVQTVCAQACAFGWESYTKSTYPEARMNKWSCKRDEKCCVKATCRYERGSDKTHFGSSPPDTGTCLTAANCGADKELYPDNNFGNCNQELPNTKCCGEKPLMASSTASETRTTSSTTAATYSSSIDFQRCTCSNVHNFNSASRRLSVTPISLESESCQVKFTQGDLECTLPVKSCDGGRKWTPIQGKEHATCTKAIW